MASDLKITLHMVSSLDGLIAKKDNSIAWFETTDNFEKGVTETNAEGYLKNIDCYVMGSKTYEHAIELSKTYGWPYGDTPTIVVSQRKIPIGRPHIELYAGDLQTLVNERLRPNYRNVWVVGGALLANNFLRLRLVDEIRMPVLPIMLGEGTRFFEETGFEQLLHLR